MSTQKTVKLVSRGTYIMNAVGSGLSHKNVSGFRLRNASRILPKTYPHTSVSIIHGTSINCSSEGLVNLDRSPAPLTDRIQILGRACLSEPSQKRKLIGQTFCSSGVCTFPETSLGVPSQTTHEKVGVLLLNLGGPETLHDVQPFLFNLFADPDIIRLPRLFRFLQPLLAQIISVVRAPKSKEGYASIGGGSPLRRITDEQAHALKLALEAKKMRANVYVGMRYWHPFTEEVVHQLIESTNFILDGTFDKLEPYHREDSYLSTVPVAIIRSWYQREGYIKSMADLIEKELWNFSNPAEVVIFFSAHGVPVSYVEDAGDPYRDQMEDCVHLIMEELKSRGIGNSHTLAYQSRVGPVQWLKPYTDEVIVQLGKHGVKSLLAVPISFVSEHIETLEEIDMEYKDLALESGIQNWGRVPALGCTPSFISDLADAVIEALPSAAAISTTKDTSQETDSDPLRLIINIC
ncbi:hypothetical protein ACLOJK_038017 [Asimina triloba]